MDAVAWQSVAAGDIFMDPRFIRAVETSMAAESSFWHVVVRDLSGNPVACASFSTLSLDLAIIAGGVTKRVVERLRRLSPSFLRIPVFLGGLPVSAAQKNLRILKDADPVAVLRLLSDVAEELAREARAVLVIYKEFPHEDLPMMDALLSLGYRRADSLPVHFFERRFRDFDEYCGALRRHYRWEIKQSRRKLTAAGYTFARIKGPQNVEAFYTPSIHRLYEAVFDHSANKLEFLPAPFFRELAQQLPDETAFTVVVHEGRVVAFMCALDAEHAYHFLICGFDYAENDKVELYFNLMYEELDHAFKSGRNAIEVGQTSDVFKSRLGCSPKPRYFYVKAMSRTWAALMHLAFPVLFPKRLPLPRFRVFRDGTTEALRESRG